MKLAWYIARHYLRPQSRGRLLSFITWVSLGGVTVGVTALVLVTGVMTGMQNELRGTILDVVPHVQIQQYGTVVEVSDWRESAAIVREVDGVTGVSPFTLNVIALTTQSGYTEAATLWGVLPDSTEGAGATPLQESIQQGRFDLTQSSDSDLPPILLGSRLAERMVAFVGDTVRVTVFGELILKSWAMTLPIREFRVSGLVTTEMFEYDSKYAYIPLAEAQDLLGFEESQVAGLGVSTDDAWTADDAADRIEQALGPDFVSTDWMEMNSALFSALALEKLAMGVILFLIVIVAAFNIVSTLVMVVVDRTREIGILKSMGMTREGVLWVFLLQGVWIGVVGTAVGTMSGIFLGWALDRFELIEIPANVYFVDRLPVDMQPADILTIVCASLLVAFAATIYPAVHASRMQPVEAIRHE